MEVLIHIPVHPKGCRPKGCIWSNTSIQGINQTYFMILFLIGLYKMETHVCLNVIKIIEPNFWSLFYHDSIIKTFFKENRSL